jgi:hypothetical protein
MGDSDGDEDGGGVDGDDSGGTSRLFVHKAIFIFKKLKTELAKQC